jgi:hypothetical protein
MFRVDQFIAVCSALIAFGTTASAETPETRRTEDLPSVMVSAPTEGREIIQISDLQPFTHIAYIPVDSDLSSIKVEGIKKVKAATKVRSVTKLRDCDHPGGEPGAPLNCTRTIYQSRVPAVKVTYSYRAPSDESGSAWSTFDVYFREDEIGPRVRRALSTGKISRNAAAELFEISTVRGSTQQLVLDEANSILCEGYYVDGSWVHTNPRCEDSVTYRKVASPSPYITVKVDSAPSSLEAVVATK